MPLIAAAAMTTALSACSGTEEPVITQKDWTTTEYFNPTDEPSPTTFYKPSVGYVGDPMPFYDPVAKNFKVMYLQEYRPNQPGTYHPFWCVETSDGVNYKSLGELISTGQREEQDAALGTGSVFYNDADKTYYTFYTGYADRVDLTGFREMVMMATSKDFKTWSKDRSLLINGGDTYSNTDFRDPMVWKGDDGKFHMIVSTTKAGKGTLVEFVSTDLHKWDLVGDFMNMMWDRFYECPDLFKMGDWWYLIYSEKHDAIRKVQYFKGHTLDELKACTENDAGIWPDDHEGYLDSRGMYAGKTASDGTNRYLWGWCGTRAGNDNTAEFEWAGNLVAYKLIQKPDGSLTLGELPAIVQKYNKSASVEKKQIYGDASVSGTNIDFNGTGSVLFGRLGKHNRISFTVKTSDNMDRFGFSFCRGTDSKKYYTLVVNPEWEDARKINLEEEGEHSIGFLFGNDGYVFPRPEDNVYNVTIVTDNSVLTMYINGTINYTTRIYGMSQNCWSINSYGGSIKVENITITQY